MKKIALGLLAATFSISGIFAQETGKTRSKKAPADKSFHARPKHEGRGQFKSLNLTKEQQEKAAAINKEYRDGIQQLKKQEATITVADFKAKHKELQQIRRSQFENILTADQKNQLAKIKADRQKNRPAMKKGKGFKMDDQLGLSSEQTAKMKTLRDQTRKEIESIKNDKSLTDDQKKQQTIAAFKKQREEMKSVLTPEQQKKIETMPKPQRRHMAK